MITSEELHHQASVVRKFPPFSIFVGGNSFMQNFATSQFQNVKIAGEIFSSG